MNLFKVCAAAAILILSSCSSITVSGLAETSYESLNDQSEIIVLTHQEDVKNSQFVGKVKSKSNALMANCGYDKVLEDAKEAARKYGANVLQIKELKKPGKLKTCYDIEAEMYVNSNDKEIESIQSEIVVESKKLNVIECNYAIVHFFRDRMFAGSAVGYRIRKGEKIIGKVRNGGKLMHMIKEPGKYTFSAKTESNDKVELDIEMGREYFIKCGLKPGLFVARPELSLVENRIIETYFDLVTD